MALRVIFIFRIFPVEGRSTRLKDMRPLVGGMANISIQLAKLDPTMTVKLAAILGNDGEGEHCMEMLSEYPNIDLSGITREGTTSTTMVLNTMDTKTRSFLSRPGTSNFFCLDNIDWDVMDADVMVLEYLLSLDRCDEDDPEYGTHAGRILHEAQSRGMRTAIDFSSRVNERAPHILKSALPYTNYCVMNESECEGTTQMTVTDEEGKVVPELVEKALNYMADNGCNTWAVVHAPEACFGLDCATREFVARGTNMSEFINRALDAFLASGELPGSPSTADTRDAAEFSKFVEQSSAVVRWSEGSENYKDLLRTGKRADYESLA